MHHEGHAQDITSSSMKTFLIYKFAQNIKWENEESIDTFFIGIFGSDKALLSELKVLNSVTLKDKPISIISFNNSIDITRTHILYVTNDKNYELKKILKRVTGNNTLLISDRCNNKNIIMINFLPLKGKKVQFELNKANLFYENLTILPDLLLLGGTEVDIAELYKESQRSLLGMNERLELLEDSLNSKNKEILRQNREINLQKKNILIHKQEIAGYQGKIESQQKKLSNLINEISVQQKTLDSKSKILIEQESEIRRKEDNIEKQSKEQKKLASDIKIQKEKIEDQKSKLNTYAIRLEKQKSLLYIFIIICILISGLVFFIYRGYKIKKDVNRKLEEKNITITERNRQITQQKEEILASNEALEQQKEELQTTLENLKQTQSQLIQAAKMASLGQLTAGVAHELNNPINFISGNVSPLERDLREVFSLLDKYDSIIKKYKIESKFKDVESLKEKLNFNYLVQEIVSLLDGIDEGAQRTSQIVKGLRSFSRLDEDEFIQTDIHEGIDSTLLVLRNKIKNRITIHKNYGDIPKIMCLPTKLNQVFMNIITNGIQAIEEKGEIFIETTRSNNNIKISFRDTGAGISDEVKRRIFEPFYTTKGVGKGIGLGLSISFGIIEKHNGDIDVISELDKGTEFVISLPINQPNK